MRSPLRSLRLALESLGMLAIFGLMFSTILDIGLRLWGGGGLPGNIDLVMYWWMVPATFLGIVAAERQQEHVSVSVITDRLAQSWRNGLRGISMMVSIGFAVLVGLFGLLAGMEAIGVGESAPASQVLIWPVRFVVPVAMAAYAFQVVASHLASEKAESPVESDGV